MPFVNLLLVQKFPTDDHAYYIIIQCVGVSYQLYNYEY
jgi:hypothetical protein